MIYYKKTYNKCKIHNKQLVDQNDPRSKEKGNTLIITDPNDHEKKKKILVSNCRCDYEDLNCICVWCKKNCCSRRKLARYDNNLGLFEYLIKPKSNNKSGTNQYTKSDSRDKELL